MIHGLEMLCVCQGPYVQGLLSIKAPLAKWSFLDVQITRVWTFIWTHKVSTSYHQFEFASTLMSLYPPFGLRPFGRTYAIVLYASKYTDMYLQSGQNSTI